MDYLDRNTDYERPDVAFIYDELSLWSSHFGRLLMEHIPMQSGIQLLDVGCGNGFPLFELAHTMGPEGTYVGIDAWAAAIDRAKQKREVYALKNVEIVLGDAHELPWPSETFDQVVSSIGINNFRDPKAAIGECYRVLKPGGRLCIATNLRGHMHEFYSVYESVLRNLDKADCLPALQRNIDHRADLPTIHGWLTDHDFSIWQTIPSSFTMRYANGSALLRHTLTVFGFLDGWRSIVPQEWERHVFGEIERTLNELAASQGELRMTVPMAYVEAEKRPPQKGLPAG